MLTTDDVRRIALALPGAYEDSHFGAASFRVKKKIFCVLRVEGRMTLGFDPEDQRNLMQVHPGLIEPVSGRGAARGWSLVRLDGCDEALAASFLKLAWSGVASRKLVAANPG